MVGGSSSSSSGGSGGGSGSSGGGSSGSSSGGGSSSGNGDGGGSSGSSSKSKAMCFQWAHVASTFHIDPSIHSSSAGIHLTGEGGYAGENGYGGADDHKSRLLCEEAAFISQLSSQEVNLTHVEDSRKQRIYSLRCFAHLLRRIIEEMSYSKSPHMMMEDSEGALKREYIFALRDIVAYLVVHDSVNRYMYAYFQNC